MNAPVSVTDESRTPDGRLLHFLVQVPIYASYLHDAVNVYARALTEVLVENVTNVRNGTAILSKIKGRMYESMPVCVSNVTSLYIVDFVIGLKFKCFCLSLSFSNSNILAALCE
jgi:hypothetical protein